MAAAIAAVDRTTARAATETVAAIVATAAAETTTIVVVVAPAFAATAVVAGVNAAAMAGSSQAPLPRTNHATGRRPCNSAPLLPSSSPPPSCLLLFFSGVEPGGPRCPSLGSMGFDPLSRGAVTCWERAFLGLITDSDRVVLSPELGWLGGSF